MTLNELEAIVFNWTNRPMAVKKVMEAVKKLLEEYVPKNDIIILIMERKKRTQCHMCATRHINMCYACNDTEMRTYLNLLGIKSIDELDKKLEELKEK